MTATIHPFPVRARTAEAQSVDEKILDIRNEALAFPRAARVDSQDHYAESLYQLAKVDGQSTMTREVAAKWAQCLAPRVPIDHCWLQAKNHDTNDA